MNNRYDKGDRRILPYFVEFVKFSSAFAAIITFALVTLHFAGGASL